MIDELAEIAANYGYAHEWNILSHDILAAVARNPLAYVKPKPLEWVEDDKCWYAKSAVGEYSIELCPEHGYLVQLDGHYDNWVKYPHEGYGFETLEAAQAAAETHRNEMLAKEFAQ